ncbi:hypothetical protein BABINDRAFT_161972 [Babjeviella inositovora NRRL Y-12698]|uniref:Major facilitator superfamily (MFS) profile domain-containing protein n=1 Tax=Babjeviella inositovora NRRL Y-12698 TaxID=984486 RepID=A0A1E3QRL8_9ASCO|nr:uncharacterized protein BABINDRAFT_161972 [Babjeviella inositovora NRRL Y-12698]ODQ79587.1 hypothetical protein BABINDRAFT_161972 [Babjeviella inositovora NRRL Y-12698]
MVLHNGAYDYPEDIQLNEYDPLNEAFLYPQTPPDAAPPDYSEPLDALKSSAASHPQPTAGLPYSTTLNSSGKLGGARLLYFTSVFVSLGVFLFGYDQGVYSGIITFPAFQKYFRHPSSAQIGMVVSVLELGALILSLTVGYMADRWGRKRTILLGAGVFIAGGAVQTFTGRSILLLVLGRVVSGLGVGLLSSVIPLYQSEISPSHARGRLACVEFTGNICGYAASVWIDYSCTFINQNSNLVWRVPLFIQCVLGLLLFAGAFFIVESPRWLIGKNDAHGYLVLRLLYADSPETAEREFHSIKEAILREQTLSPPEQRSYRAMFRTHFRRLVVGCSALLLAQLNGINIISYYAPLVFAEAGFKGNDALFMAGVNALVYLASTIPPWFLVDRWGRRPIFISGALTMGTCLFLISLAMWMGGKSTPTFVALLVVVYNAAFGYSWGPIGWLYPAEIYPLSIRAKGVSLSTACNWLFNFIVGQMTPILQETISWRLYLIPGVCCLVSAVVVFRYFPETKGVDLEEVGSLFDGY